MERLWSWLFKSNPSYLSRFHKTSGSSFNRGNILLEEWAREEGKGLEAYKRGHNSQQRLNIEDEGFLRKLAQRRIDQKIMRQSWQTRDAVVECFNKKSCLHPRKLIS